MQRPTRHLGVATLLALLASILSVVGLASPASAATNFVDNNGYWIQTVQDGLINFAGNSSAITSPVTAPECSDGINNDAARGTPGVFQDLLVDAADPQCVSPADNSEVQAGLQVKAPITLGSFITKAGAMAAPVVSWPPSYIYTTSGLITFSVTAVPVNSPATFFNAGTGAVQITMNLTLTVGVVAGTTTFSCSTPAFPVVLSTVNAHPANPIAVSPSPYSAATGLMTLADNNFVIPPTQNSIVQGFCDQVNAGFNLPVYSATTPNFTAPGTSALQFRMRSFPATSATSMNNHQPVATVGADQTVAYGAPVTLTGGGTDVDTVPAVGPAPTPGPIGYRWTQTAGPSVPSFSPTPLASPGANVNLQNPTFTPSLPGTYSFRLEVADGSGIAYSTSTATVNVTVNPPAAPVANADSYSTAFNTALNVAAPGVLSNDTGTGVTVTSHTSPGHGAVTQSSDGSLFYTPTTGYTGSDSYTYTVTDVASQTSTATVNLTVDLPAAPVANADPYSTPSNVVLTVPAPGVLGNDTGTAISVTSNGSPSHGSVTVNTDGSFSYTPTANYQGGDSFSYAITDGASQTSAATVSLTVTNTAPVANAGASQSVASGAVGVTLTGSASADPDSGPSPLTYAWTQTGGSPVTLSGANTAAPTFAAPALYCSATSGLTFHLTVSDGAATSSASTTVTVNKPVVTGHPVGDYNGDGTADPVAYNQTTGTWQVRCQGTFLWGSPGDLAVPGDYNGDGITDVASYTPKTSPGGNGTWVGNEGLWKIRGQLAFRFAGLQGDIPVPADYFGGGVTRGALFRPSEGNWYIRPLGAPQFGVVTPTIVHLGQVGDIPIPGDYNGDGVADLAVYRPSTGQWIIANGLNVSALITVKPNFPLNLRPMVADYDGNGTTDIMGVDPTTGWWYLNGHGNIAVGGGVSGDQPMAADYHGTGSALLGRYRSAGAVAIDGEAPFFFGGAGYAPVTTAFFRHA